MRNKFEIIKRNEKTKGRVGRYKTPHGYFETPNFMPVGTQGTVKGLCQKDLKEIGVQILLCNIFHLISRPGTETIKSLGGIHKFISWDLPILTDSGGYQVFSLSTLRRVVDEGVEFTSPIDGSLVFHTPENILLSQQEIGVDIMMPLDEPVAYPVEKGIAKNAMSRSLEWLKRSKKCKTENEQSLFGIIHGGIYKDLRKESIEKTIDCDVDGIAIGGLCLGENINETFEVVQFCKEHIPDEMIVYLMGIGTPEDILKCVELGVDLFDCVLPTRNGRSGWAYTSDGVLKVRNSDCRTDSEPIDKNCFCYVCKNFSRAYIRHLFNSDEMLGPIFVSYHNLYFYENILKKFREEHM